MKKGLEKNLDNLQSVEEPEKGEEFENKAKAEAEIELTYYEKKQNEEESYILWLYQKFLRPTTIFIVLLILFTLFIVVPFSSMGFAHTSVWAWIVDYAQGFAGVLMTVATVVITNVLGMLFKRVRDRKKEIDKK